MKTATILLVAAVSVLLTDVANATDACGPDEKTLHAGEPCIPTHLFNYLYCLVLLCHITGCAVYSHSGTVPSLHEP
jgi:hypothetical protein